MKKCINCKKELKGHNKPIRCKSCARKFLYPNGRNYPKCLDCGIALKTYHSQRCRICAHSGKNSSQFKDGRTSKKDYDTNYTSNRRKIDMKFRIAGNLRSRIRVALKKICKSKSTTILLGCSIKQLKQHLEKQFKPGMTWANYGKWHIDHIKPCVSFDLSKLSQQRKCFHYTNLQPLWAEENLRKNKY